MHSPGVEGNNKCETRKLIMIQKDKKIQRTEMDRLIEEFLEHLEIERQSSPLTIRNYRHYLGRFSSWFKNNNANYLSIATYPSLLSIFYFYLVSRIMDASDIYESILLNCIYWTNYLVICF